MFNVLSELASPLDRDNYRQAHTVIAHCGHESYVVKSRRGPDTTTIPARPDHIFAFLGDQRSPVAMYVRSQ